jgi:HCOMODA/2-hydroxy-3-carboxy-muconic semialdehyde decarboxylase
MNKSELLEELVTANRILAHERVLDSFGHVSIRNPEAPGRFYLSRSRAPALIEAEDIMEFTLEGRSVGAEPGKPYSERFIHAGIYEARPDVNAVVHNHSPSVIPFSVTGMKLRPLMHMCAPIGDDIPTWDIRTKFGDGTNLLVTNLDMGRDLASCLADRTVTLMRGHGSTVVGRSLREVVFTSIYMELNADMQIRAMGMGEVEYLSPAEIAAISRGRAGFTFERGWENWCRRVGRPYVPGEWEFGEGYSRTDSKAQHEGAVAGNH